MQEVNPPEPAIGTWRVRLGLTTTVKDGYRVGDATIEFTETATFDGDMPREEIKNRLKELIEDGETVAAQLNQQNVIAKTTNVTAPINHKEHNND